MLEGTGQTQDQNDSLSSVDVGSDKPSFDCEPESARLLQDFLNVENPNMTEPELDPEPGQEILENVLLRTIRRINLTCLKPASLMMTSVAFDSAGHHYDALIDSGADVNLILENLVTELGLPVEPSQVKLKGLGKGEQTTVGIVRLSPVLHGWRFSQTKFFVVPHGVISEPLVLGHEFLKENRVCVDCAKSRLSVTDPVTGTVWELYLSEQGKPCQQIWYGMALTAADSVHLTDSETVLIAANVLFPGMQYPVSSCPSCLQHNSPEYFYDGKIIKEGLKDKASGIPGILSMKDDQANVLIKGHGDGPAWIKKGDFLGKVYTMVTLDPPESVDEKSPADHIVKAISELPLADDLVPAQEEQFREMLQSHLPVISTGDDDVGECASTPIRIQLYDETPIHQRVRRFSPPITDAIEKQCKELCDLGIIEPSISPWSSPVVPVIKPDKTIRLCVDYRQLNKVTVPDRFPMPNLTESVFSLHGIQYFTSLDLVRGYYQLPMAEESKKLTAFSTAFGHWQFKRLSFGLKNAPAVFQREMQRILREFPKAKVIVYIDDILILGNSFEEHLALVDKVLGVMQEHGLKIKLPKCSWVQTEVKYLGHLVGRTGMKKLPAYVQKVDEFPKPTTVRELRSFLGFVNFQRKFIPRCSVIAKPLSRVTGGRKSQGTRKLKWTEEMETAFLKLKEALKEDILLTYPDYSRDAKPLELYVDASGEGAGACLCQEQNGECSIIAFDSMTFLDSETRYSTIERELAALRWGVKTFRSFLYGQYFIIHTDHRPLMYLQDMKMIDSRLSRTLEELSEFDFLVKYCPGDQNVAADWLSRIPNPESRPQVFDDSFQRLPAGLRVHTEVKGGPSSLVEALATDLELLYEEQGVFVEAIPTGNTLRKMMVQQFLKDSTRLGFTLDRAAKNRIKSMMYPGNAPALELLLAFSKCFNVEVWVHFGPTCPVVYCDPTVLNALRVHLQCLGGVHFNPVIELKSFEVPTDVVSGSKITTKKSLEEIDPPEELDEPVTTEVLYSQVSEVTCPVPPNCQHATGHSAQCVVLCNSVPYCSLIDIGAQVCLVNETVLANLGDDMSATSNVEEEALEGLGRANSKVLGNVSLSLEFPGGCHLPEFPFAVISSEDIDFCFVLGRNILREAGLSLDYSCGMLMNNGQHVTPFCGPSSNACDTSCLNSPRLMTIVGTMTCPELVDHTLITLDQLREIQRNHRQLQTIVKLVLNDIPVSELPRSLKKFKRVWSHFVVDHGLLFKKDKEGRLVMVLTFSVLVDLVTKIHMQQSHIGIYKMTNMLKRLVWHHSLNKVIRDVCRTCSVCQKCKVSNQVVIPPTLKITTTSPFELVAMDLISLPITSCRYVGCLMMVDHFTKWVTAIPIRNKQSRTICRALEHNILPNVPRVPVRILTDNGPEFTSQEFRTVLERFNIVHVKTTPYKPSSNGAVERVNRTIGEFLRVLTNEVHKWDEFLPNVLLTYNHTVHSETGSTPAEMIMRLSHNVNTLPLLSAGISDPWAEGHPRYKPFAVGSLVLRKTILLGNLTSNKLVPRFDGPYHVIKVNTNKITYELVSLEDGKVVKAHHVQLKPWHQAPTYITKHFQYYSPMELEDDSLSDPSPVISTVPPVLDSAETETPSSSSEDRLPDVPLKMVTKYFDSRTKVRQEPGMKTVKSILKVPRTFERKRALKMWEGNSTEFDPCPSLTPELVDSQCTQDTLETSSLSALDSTVLDPSVEIDFSSASESDSLGHAKFAVATSSFVCDESIQHLLDWDVSPVGSLTCEASLEAPDSMKTQDSLENPFRNPDGSIKDRRQLQVEVELMRDIYGHDYQTIAESLWNKSSSVEIDFSGFSSVASEVFPRIPALSASRKESPFTLVATPRRTSLSPVIRDIRQARELIAQNRERTRARLIDMRRRPRHSPPLTRSRGRPVPLPWVTSDLPEREMKRAGSGIDSL